MVYSMTGFGSSTKENNLVKVDVEIKSLNSKFLDLNIRLPKVAQPFEMDFRNVVNQRVKRGKIMLNINATVLNTSLAKRGINRELFLAYKNDLEKLADENALQKDDLLQIILSLPDVIETPENESDDDVKEVFLSALSEAIDALDTFRLQEGETLSKELAQYAKNILNKLREVDANKQLRVDKMRKKLQDLLDKHLTNEQKDTGRLEQEVVFYIERFDITEEIVRLEGHINYFLKELGGEGSGKKLGFIAQEMGREINTIGSKANDEQIQHLVVHMKDDLEKIKEQVLNIL
ncbi:YicC family protein [bacterium]|nr:YicC family protein [bacterium]